MNSNRDRGDVNTNNDNNDSNAEDSICNTDFANSSVVVMFPVHQVGPKPSCKGTAKEGKRQGGKRKWWEDNISEWTVPEGSGEQGKMKKTDCKIICGAPTTLAVKGLMLMVMTAMSHARSGRVTCTFFGVGSCQRRKR